jgi:uncharacterized sulfatase
MARLLLVVVAALLLLAPAARAADQKLPNILWLTTEDIGPHLGVYGDPNAVTPNLDKLARRGTWFLHAWSNAPVCAPARTTIISGVYPPSMGAENMRSEVAIPSSIQLYPQLLKQAGYYCTNHTKTDYNVTYSKDLWDDTTGKAHWKNRKPGQPFFAVFNDLGTHESQIRTRPHQWVHDPAKMRIPAYHPDTIECRQDWAQYYDNITDMDGRMGVLLKELDDAGVAEDTIIFFYGDHGSGMPRSKRWPYNSGLQVPLLLYVPPKWQHLAPKEYQPGKPSERLVSFVDLAPTLVSITSTKPPAWMQGYAFMGPHQTEPQPFLYGFRGRMDERYDFVRSVTDGRYVYIRNYMPQVIYGQYIQYMFQTPTTRVWKHLFDEHKTTEAQSHFWQTKPAEELYDLTSDPDEVNNLVNSPEHAAILAKLRAAQRAQVSRTRDGGFLPEAEQHRRAEAAKTTIYELLQNDSTYALEKIWAMADAASLGGNIKPGLHDSDSGVRYWAAMGHLMRGGEAVKADAADLRPLLNDESPSVRIAAAWALAAFSDSDRPAALETLKQLAPADVNGAYVSLLALNAIDNLGDKAEALKPLVKSMAIVDTKAPARAQKYGGNIRNHILGITVPMEDENLGKANPKKKKK